MQLNFTPWPRLMAATAVLAVAGLAAWGQALVRNPSFENNLNDQTEPLAPGAPQGWPYYSQIDEWTSGGGGVNDLTYDPGGPFHNAGTPVPDGRRIGFKQGSGAVSQDIHGLQPGRRYWIQFRYDARNGSDLDLEVRFSTVNFGGTMNEVLDVMRKVRPAIATGSPYYSRTVPFTPDLDVGTLSFEVTARGDSTVLLDAVTLVQREEGNFPVMNPSFEASGIVYDGASTAGTPWPVISGWALTGTVGLDDGTGGQADNGRVPDQALVVFLDGESSISQTLQPLVPGESYEVQFAYNAKSGTSPTLQVRVGDTVLWEQAVTAVGGGAAYRTASLSFTPTADSAVLRFASLTEGATALLDDVKVLGAVGTALPAFEMAPARLLLRGGQEAMGSITIPEERLEMGPAVMQLRSANPNVFVLPDAAANGVLNLNFAGETTRTFTVRAVGVGNAAVEIVDAAGLPLPDDITTVFVAGTSFVLNPSFELDKDSGVATAPVSGWTTGGGNIGMAESGNPFLSEDDLAIPDRRKVLRIQGGGTVSQLVDGLRPGQLYGLQFFYNGRMSGYPYQMTLEVNFAGQNLGRFADIVPAGFWGMTDYYFEELRFTPSAASGSLEFKVTVTQGDATLFLDAVSIVPRITGEIAVKNSSFESSAMGINWPGYVQPDRIAGWVVTPPGGGHGINAYSPRTFFVEPFLDNGINSDQDNVFFAQGAISLRQVVEGLTPGQPYTLVLDYNNRDGRGMGSTANPNPGQIQITWDGQPVFDSGDFLPVDTVTPWTGFRHTLPFYQAFVPVSSLSGLADLSIAHVGVVGDETLLVDNVRIVPGTRTPPVLTQEPAARTAQSGDTVTFQVAASGSNLSHRWLQDGVALADGNGVSGSATPTLTLTDVQPASAGVYTVLVTDGVGVAGSAAALTVEAPADIALAIARLPDGTVRIAWPAAASGFRLQSAPAVNGPYTDDPAAAVVEGDELVVILEPQASARFFRLTN